MTSGCCFGAVYAVIVVIHFLRTVVNWFYQNLFGPMFFGPQIDVRKMGEWALITGATEGIGKAYAKLLSQKGLNLVLVSRSYEKLERVSKEIGEASKVEIKIIAVDFTHGKEIYDKIEKEIAGLEIGVLVNNVGLSYPHPEYFLSVENSDELFQNIISCNIFSVIYMCKKIMPQMVERKKGVIINISSLAASIPNPLLTIYSSSKAFVDKFSADLQTEYKENGIIVQSVRPGFVATNMSKITKPSWSAPIPDIFVASAIKTLGVSQSTTGYFPHALLKLGLDAVAAIFCAPSANNLVLKQLKGYRNNALKKAKKT